MAVCRCAGVCGAAAGITSAYTAPIAGALFFVIEIILDSIAMESFGLVVVSSVVANITMREFAGSHPPYEMPLFRTISNIEVLWFVVLSIRSREGGNGYEVVNPILHHPWTWRALVAVLLLKVLATCASVGFGAAWRRPQVLAA